MPRESIHARPSAPGLACEVWCFSPQWSNQPYQNSPHMRGTFSRKAAKFENSRSMSLSSPKLMTESTPSSVPPARLDLPEPSEVDRKSTRLNSSHLGISYAV